MSKELKKKIIEQQQLFNKALTNVKQTIEQIETLRIQFLGRSGTVSMLMHQLKGLSLNEKKELGPLLNNLKASITKTLDEQRSHIQQKAIHAEQERRKYFDVTSYIPHRPKGSLHPYTVILQELIPIFISMGFEIVEGPEIESDFHNFEALNIPADHPARDTQDTFWLTLPHMLLRTHTSAVQVHQLQQRKPPLALVAPGRVYRNEATDASHDTMFMQLEGLVVGRHISLAELLGTVKHIFQAIFNTKQIETRIRTSYFPFVEPGIEIDISCPFCQTGCSVCKYSHWIEGGGAGLIHPNVLDFCNIDATEYSGFAFGFGLTRLVMLKYGITDIRLLHANKVDFLKQF